MKTYSFDIVKMIRWLMPYFLLKPIHLAWLTTLNITLKNRYAEFLAYRQLTLANATINSSVNRLTQALWDSFDTTQSIYLQQNPSYHQTAYIYLQKEFHSLAFDYLNKENQTLVFDYQLREASLSGVNFIVRVPTTLYNSKLKAIEGFVKKYVFSGLVFTVEKI